MHVFDPDMYWDPGILLSHNAMFNLVIGMRGDGKSYGAKNLGIRQFLKYGWKFIVLRRTNEDIRATAPKFFADIQDKYAAYLFRIQGSVGYIADKPASPVDDQGRTVKPRWREMCFFADLNTSGATKSIPYPDVHLIIFDEFLSKNGRYLKNEPVLLQEFYLTVDRYQDRTRLIMLGNAAGLANPYFPYWHIQPSDKEYKTYAQGYICVQFVNSEAFKRTILKTRFGDFIHNQEYAQYAIENKFDDEDTSDIYQLPKDLLHYGYSVEFENATISVYSYGGLDDKKVHIKAGAPPDAHMYTTIHSHTSSDRHYVDRKDALMKILVNYYRQGGMTFQNVTVRAVFGDAIVSYL